MFKDVRTKIRIAPHKLGFYPKQRMTRWYEPLAMFRLLLRIWDTRRMADQRDQKHHQPAMVLDYGQAKDDFWFDYVADMGDAFDPTMCVAWHLGRKELNQITADPEAAAERPPLLPRGELLVMGGDQVYPDSSVRRYRDQLLGPFGLAWESEEAEGLSIPTTQADRAGLLAIPANHDWYGGIGPFIDAFGTERTIGGWQTAQRCSWWAARLAHGWGIWGCLLYTSPSPRDS